MRALAKRHGLQEGTFCSTDRVKEDILREQPFDLGLIGQPMHMNNHLFCHL